ncbi:hypothetical protein BDY21DRAFT_377751 [Lineolata rhizophorae]|uniref:DNA ligase n=1 Tax=Lineolata rhizophorae TaxID=578093 RepID=A0A6A6P5Q7_9PEZI|nr:hypothetical protein BDY21DRAFT_377751 [Lineolata rhizophorae]
MPGPGPSAPPAAAAPPAKRRRRNDGKAAPRPPARGLDWFFARQRQTGGGGAAGTPAAAREGEAEREGGRAGEARRLPDEADADADADADERLARRLQDEWDREAAAGSTAAGGARPGNGADEEDKEDGGGAVAPAARPRPPSAPTASPARPGNTLALLPVAAHEDVGAAAAVPFDESPLSFAPARYLPALRERWAAGGDGGGGGGGATYALLVRCFVLVGGTSSRIRIVDALVNLLRTLIEGDPESLLPAVWLSTNAISPPYIDLELGLGGSAISKALKKVCGLDNQGLKTLYNKCGDAGDVAFEAKKRQSFTLRKPKPLTIRGVYEGLVRIAKCTGKGSQEGKQRIVDRLLQDARGAEESRYLVRTLVQHLRIGAVKTTMLIALSRAFLLSKPPGADFPTKSPQELASLKKEDLADLYARSEELVKASFARHPNYNDLVPTLLATGVCPELLARCGLALHAPLRPMLGSITRDLADVLAKLGDARRAFACEFKYDGQRAQLHCDPTGRVSIFSRRLELMTDKYPDLVAAVPALRGDGVRSFVLEGEVVAVDRGAGAGAGALLPFQTLANRARKDVRLGAVQIDVCLFAFDLMFLNGEELLDRPLRERRELLRSLFVEVPGKFTWVRSLDARAEEADKVRAFFREALEAKCEGIMVKVLDNPAGNGAGDEAAGGEDDGPAAPPPTPRKTPKKQGKKTAALPSAAAVADRPQAQQPPPSTRRKALLATYEPDKRLESWLKVKKDYDRAAADTLDLVPVAGWHGQGRKHKWWSPVLLAARNPESGTLDVVTKCMSGFSDRFYREMRARYDPGVLGDGGAASGGGAAGGDDGGDEDDDGAGDGEASGGDAGSGDADEGDPDDAAPDRPPSPPSGAPRNVVGAKPALVTYSGPEPDVWFVPGEVWEVAFADVTLSPTYRAAVGLVSDERGLSLRFPRFLGRREDKGVEEASEVGYLAELWWRQEARGKGEGGGDGEADGNGAGEEEGNGAGEEEGTR